MSNITKAAAALERYKSMAANIREKAEESIGYGIQAAEVAGAAGLAGYVNTKFGQDANGNPTGELQIKGVPADLLAGIGIHALAFLGGAGKHAEHAHNVADGLVAAYAYRAGANAATTGGNPNQPYTP